MRHKHLVALHVALLAACALRRAACAPAQQPPPSPACAELARLNFSTTLPVVLVTLVNGSGTAGITPAQAQLLAKGRKLPGVLTTCNVAAATGGDGEDYEGVGVKLHVRGSSSAAEYAKKSLALDTLDQSADLGSAEKRKIRLLGFPKDHTWVLHGPENDRTLGMRNWLAYGLARRMGRYASRTALFELFLNTEPGTPLTMGHYRGVYQLHEKVSRGKHRVNVTKWDGSDLSGGYLLSYENDNTAAKDVTLNTKLTRLTMIVDYPKRKRANETVVKWLQDWMNVFEAQLLRQPVANLSSVLDVPAAIDYFLGTEVTKNPDGYRGSVKMHKDRGGPLVMGPMWDYNEAFGMCCGYPITGSKTGGRSNGTSGGSVISAAGWRFNICADAGRCTVEPADGTSQWYRRLWQDPAFRTAAAARWQQLRAQPSSALGDDYFTGEIASLKRQLDESGAGERNWQRWSLALNQPAYGPPFASWAAMFSAETQLLRDWTLARLKWLDAAFAAQAAPDAPPDAYRSLGYVAAEPPNAGPAQS